MQLFIDKLGKVAITVEEGYWDINKDYDKLVVVEKKGIFGTYISRKPVPAGTELTNRKYWIPFSSLQEEIVIDYNNFINKYKNILEQYGIDLKKLDTRITNIENIKSHVNKLISSAEQLKDIAKTSLDRAEEAVFNSRAALDTVNLTLNTVTDIREQADEVVKIANDASKLAKSTATKADNVLLQANQAKNTANEANNKANKAIEVANEMLQKVCNFLTIAKELQTEIAQQKEDVYSALGELKYLHKHICERIESLTESIGQANGIATLDENGKLSAEQLPILKTINNESIVGEGNITIDLNIYRIVTELPAEGDPSKIYLVLDDGRYSTSTHYSEEEGEPGDDEPDYEEPAKVNEYIEFGFINGKWEELGRYHAKIDLTPYVEKEELEYWIRPTVNNVSNVIATSNLTTGTVSIPMKKCRYVDGNLEINDFHIDIQKASNNRSGVMTIDQYNKLSAIEEEATKDEAITDEELEEIFNPIPPKPSKPELPPELPPESEDA